MQLPQHWARSSPRRSSFFPDGFGTCIPLSKLVKDLGVQTDNAFSPSAQCTEAANKGRRLIFMIRRSFQDLSKSAFMPLYEATRLATGIRHLPYEERLQRLGLHYLQRWRLWVVLITAFKMFTGLLDMDPNVFFLPPARRGFTGLPYKALKGTSHRRRKGSAFSVRVVRYWNKHPASPMTEIVSPKIGYPPPSNCTPNCIYSPHIYL